MERFLLKSKNRITENRGALNIHHCYDKDKYNIPFAGHFNNLISIRDCEIKPNMGILPHRDENIELITIPLIGTLVQKNNFGETHHLTPGSVQVMSTGSGISHFEYNESTDATLNCIQFCIIPKVSDTKPKSHLFTLKTNKKGLQEIISPKLKSSNYTGLFEDLYLSYGFMDSNTTKNYYLKNNTNGILILIISGKIEVNGEVLENRDTLVLRNISDLTIVSKKSSKFFLFEI